MAETMPDDSSGAPVERLARSLLACARDATIPAGPVADGRRRGTSRPDRGIAAIARAAGRVAGCPPSHRPSDRNPYLEELVAIAVSTARQAEDAARRASDACVLARRDRFAWVGFGVLGIVIGIAGVVDAHWIPGWNHRQVEMVSETRLPDEPKGTVGAPPGPSTATPSAAIPAQQPAGRSARQRPRGNRRASSITGGGYDRRAPHLVDRFRRGAAPL